MREKDVWILMPLAGNFVWLIVTTVVGPASLPYDGVGAELLAMFVSGVAMLGILGFIVHDVGPLRTFLVMATQTVILILLYAELYLFRLHDQNVNFGDALYYSTVTWTSLGYTDLQPVGEMKIVTAVQAITGYVFLGLLVSVLSSAVGQARR